MKINELQIGDYVRHDDSIYIIEEVSMKGWVHIITADKWRCRVDMSSDYILDWLQPIEITPEILENWLGFDKYIDLGNIVYWRSKDKRVVLHNNDERKNTNERWYVHIDNEDMETMLSCELTNLHELQHMLMHCGIEIPEIIL